MIEKGKCYFCKKETVVARVTPASKEEQQMLTGTYLNVMDEEFSPRAIGVVCKECMFSEDTCLSLGFCGGLLKDLDNWEAYLE